MNPWLYLQKREGKYYILEQIPLIFSEKKVNKDDWG